MKNILVIGGAGYIGSHTVVELVKAGHRPIIIDNFNNSERSVLARLKDITGQEITCYEQSYQDSAKLREVIQKESVSGIIHFAAYKAVGESVADPLKYYSNNVAGFVELLKTVLDEGVTNFVFSSSAAVYGEPPTSQVTEQTPTNPESPYGQSKRMDEIILRDTCFANDTLKGVALRYFNVVGAHDSGKLGELGRGKPQNLLPFMLQAIETNKPLIVFGNDYDTPDGTCLRDYIHVVDLARAHVAALKHLEKTTKGGYDVYNIGTGIPTSVMELIIAFEQINKVKVPYELGDRRPGDPSNYYASGEKAREELGWEAKKTIEDAVRDAWRWQQNISK
jgi:UDP-glucose 4-epimerase